MKENEKNVLAYDFFRFLRRPPKDGVERILFNNGFELHYEVFVSEGQRMGRAMHIIGKLLHLGNLQFKAYEYEVKGRNLTPEEKEYWFKLFVYTKIDF